MATIFDGERPVNTEDINSSGVGTPGTIYTVPAGRYARLDIHYYKGDSSSTFGWKINGVFLGTEFTSAADGNKTFWMTAGDTISHTTSANWQFYALVREYEEI